MGEVPTPGGLSVSGRKRTKQRAPRRPMALAMSVAVAALAASVGLGQMAASAAVPPAVVTEEVLHSFGGGDGAGPLSGVSVGPGGVLYGTTVFGGTYGGGTVFTLTPRRGGYRERILYSFDGADGAKPAGNVVADARGDLFGDTSLGGAWNWGNVFELVRKKRGYSERVLYSFTGYVDGQEPVGAPVLDAHGDVFGTTQFGGAYGRGAVFEVSPAHAGYTERVLHSFPGTFGQPQAGLAISADGRLYGTIYGFGSDDPYGSVFSLRPTKTGAVYTDLYDFQGAGDGENPFATLTIDDATGVIYGTTEYGGTDANGTVFSLTPSDGRYQERVLWSFTRGRDGVIPQSPVLRTFDGRLYGTTALGGVGCSGIGCGAVYVLVPSGPEYRYRVLHRFTGPPDGAGPAWSGLALSPGGELFGTTRSGGTETGCADGGSGGVLGCGTVYELAT